MRHEDFEQLVKMRIEQTEKLLLNKGAEYAEDIDRLSNFRDGMHLLNRPMESVCFGYVAKHIVALSTFIQRLEQGIEVDDVNWEEKIGDIITYMILLDACHKDGGF